MHIQYVARLEHLESGEKRFRAPARIRMKGFILLPEYQGGNIIRPMLVPPEGN